MNIPSVNRQFFKSSNLLSPEKNIETPQTLNKAPAERTKFNNTEILNQKITIKRTANSSSQMQMQFAQLERELNNGRLGVFVLDTGNNKEFSYRSEERFPVCSTFKILVAANILKRSAQNPEFMEQRLRYTQQDLVTHSPITKGYVKFGSMTISGLLDAMLEHSDNTATNLLMKKLGGPSQITEFARSIGDNEFRLDNWEPNLNTAPHSPDDTSTPAAMGRILNQLLFKDALNGGALETRHREKLRDGLLKNTTANEAIRKGIPRDWHVGDRSGSGSYGTRNDIAVLWPPNPRSPIILAVYTTQGPENAEKRDDIIASVARIVAANRTL